MAVGLGYIDELGERVDHLCSRLPAMQKRHAVGTDSAQETQRWTRYVHVSHVFVLFRL